MLKNLLGVAQIVMRLVTVVKFLPASEITMSWIYMLEEIKNLRIGNLTNAFFATG